ncbi:sigma factor-like helix-turn-helix DNA-binding protein [Ruminococcus sp. Marseille-P6503]|uniref:sigma factor-like helix-turn-helix DNA-binding protein n=1 Tax=Ruminococcus sp. Marseille-P6503 TaxID=2364796 RepID=UPI000F545D05|nr:sigma factor-like helix-turn-helix DNA-binding protein [Ruminococcus sp. Marseille-P6503]
MSRRVSLDETAAVFSVGGIEAEEGRRLYKNARELLWRCVDDNLTKTQKRYIILYYKKNLTVTQIAALSGVNKSTVSRTISRGRVKLASAVRMKLLEDIVGGCEERNT